MINLCDIKDITKIKVIDNSCGDGAFICEIVKQIVEANPNNIKQLLEENVFGIELDKQAYQQCLNNLKKIEKEYQLPKIKWNIRNDNTLKVYQEYESKFDLVIGNPPYVRIHNTIEDLSSFEFCNKGMTDLYLAFYEIGLKMLKPNGKLCFINPSSIFNSKASDFARKTVIQNKLLTKIVNFKHMQLFYKITTYSAILLLDKTNNDELIKYYESDLKAYSELSYSDFNINNFWYFDKSPAKLQMLKQIINNKKPELFKAKNGVATLCDKVLISDAIPESEFTINIVKGSTLKETKTLFLYDDNYLPFDFDLLPKNIQEYLIYNETALKNRDLEDKEHWWTYGRTQSIKDKNFMKLCVNTTIKDVKTIKVKKINKGTLIYSGLYLNINNDEEADLISNLICSQDFIDYISMLGKYKSGGYYTFNTKDLSNYLNYYTN